AASPPARVPAARRELPGSRVRQPRAPGRPAARAGLGQPAPAPAGLAAGRAPPRLAPTRATRVPATPARLATAPATRNRSIFCDGKPPFRGGFLFVTRRWRLFRRGHLAPA